MSAEQEINASAQKAPGKPAQPTVSPEFVVRVNDFIAMANRIERRFDTSHAQLAMLHAFSRYSGHHYRTTVKGDSQPQREAFADYISSLVRELVLRQLPDLAGPIAPAEPGAEPGSSDNPA